MTKSQSQHMSDEAHEQMHAMTDLFEKFRDLGLELQDFGDGDYAPAAGKIYSPAMRQLFLAADLNLTNLWLSLRRMFCSEHGITPETFDRHMEFICGSAWPEQKQ